MNGFKYFRLKARYTQEEVGKIVGICSGCISMYERGLSEPKRSVALKIANLLSCQIDDLFREDFDGTGGERVKKMTPTRRSEMIGKMEALRARMAHRQRTAAFVSGKSFPDDDLNERLNAVCNEAWKRNKIDHESLRNLETAFDLLGGNDADMPQETDDAQAKTVLQPAKGDRRRKGGGHHAGGQGH